MFNSIDLMLLTLQFEYKLIFCLIKINAQVTRTDDLYSLSEIDKLNS